MKKTIIANWKMNLSVAKSLQFIKKIAKTKNEVVIAAPFTFLCELGKHLKNKKIKLAGQNVSQFESGAYTGDVSASMLKEEGCTYCLVGHSERRIYFKETDAIINKKIKQLLNKQIKPVLCVGENLAQGKRGQTHQVIKRQISAGLKGIKKISSILIAYEPVWAISTFQKSKIKQAATVLDIIEAHSFIKEILININKNQGKSVKILYGGTVNSGNSRQILGLKQVDGALIGGASLKISSFNDIIKSS
ncbi:MAG: triose-phosphate isomerase [Candidatus Buchananbacteria bacterium RBG_13_36_9]|uniref:Triosephosphate isomerase n=1 Tax=Candidatus Buchananbacteria bacterium RBG_13_36_9 TaxID=1797530 RepID=A0A1G1XNN4_9BACT|nr:MAG: triose-phosphate isomerase [Candidatus Buchananbacteria bacterium RBG_13_36_9]